MKKIFVNQIQVGAIFTAPFLVTSHAIKRSRDGVDYLCLTLMDRTGNIEARAWKGVDMLAPRAAVNDFIAVRAEAELFNGQVTLTVHDVERLDEADVELADYFPRSRWSSDALFRQLSALVNDEVQSPAIREFLDAIFNDSALMVRFKQAPAALRNHHAYHGGLLEHCLSMSRIAVSVGKHYEAYYPGLVRTDLLMAGCILHDLGKCQELEFDRATAYSTVGKLVGHIPLGSQWVAAYARQANLPPDLELELQHLVLAHHGKQEFGSPVVPHTAEAHLLHFIDMMDSRMNTIWKLFPDSDSPAWSDYQRSLEAPIYFRGRPAWAPQPNSPSELEGPGLARHNDEAAQLNLDVFRSHS